MKIGHEFEPEHGFTGSANPGTNMRPKIPGFTHGGMPEVEHGKHHHGEHPKHEGHMKEDKHGYQVHKGHKGHKHEE